MKRSRQKMPKQAGLAVAQFGFSPSAPLPMQEKAGVGRLIVLICH
jgi:hypothetical protein